MRYSIYVVLMFVFFFCNKNIKGDLSGMWVQKQIGDIPLYKSKRDYLKFTSGNTFETKTFPYFYSSSEQYSFESTEAFEKKSIIRLNYNVDSIDSNNGYYLRMYDDSFNIKMYSLIDYPFLINCEIKPKPENTNYLYSPTVWILDDYEGEIGLGRYHFYDLIILDSVKTGDIHLFFNKGSEKSKIKETDKKIEIQKSGIVELKEYFDPRYYVFRKFRAFVKKGEKLQKLKILYSSEINGKSIEEKIKLINKTCANSTNFLLIQYPNNRGRYYFNDNYNQTLKTGNILTVSYCDKETFINQLKEKN